MTQSTTPYDVQPPSARRLWLSTSVAVAGAALILMLVVLPAEYGIDPTGIGGRLGLDVLRGPVRTLEIVDVTGGNESYREVEIPDFGQPVPLPNPAVHQDEAEIARTVTMQITIPPEMETEVKMALQTGKMISYAWRTDRGDIYADFHGHDPEVSADYWVRYKEQQEGSGNNGSLTAPFTGEHGWYWLNYNEFPVVVTLSITGFYDDIIDYGIF